MSAKLLIHCGAKNYIMTLHAFGRMVYDLAGLSAGEIAADVCVTHEMLLKSPPLSTLSYNEKQVITGFTRSGST